MNRLMFENRWHQKGILGKVLSITFSLLTLVVFVSLFVFLIISAVPAFKHYEIFNTTEFNLTDNQASIWMPLTITLLISTIAIVIATPIGVKTATFIKFRLSEKNSKRCYIVIQTLAGIPSVIFGLFALTALGSVVKFVFHLPSAYTVINACIMLAFMVLPTIISLTINTYDSIEHEQLLNPISLGLTKTSAIYKVIRKEATGGIVVAVIIAIGRTIGETMALSMILNNSASYEILKNGTVNLLAQSLGTIGSVIATNLLSESGDANQRSVLYLFGIFLLVLVFILNIFISFLTSRKNRGNKSYEIIKKLENKIGYVVLWVPRNIAMCISAYRNKKMSIHYDHLQVNTFIAKKISHDKLINVRNYYLFLLEIICTIICFGFLAWIIIDIVAKGLDVVFTSNNSSLFSYTKNTTGQAFLNTVIIVVTSLFIAIPISLFTTIYLVEYCKNNRLKKTVFFFVDSIAASPSIIFGMFGLTIFIRTLGWTSAGIVGRSLLAGALTISIVVLPTLIRMFERALSQVSNATRESGLSMGLSKWIVIQKIVLPAAYKSLISSIVLVTGRIMGETAPLYLTAGLSSSIYTSLLNPGQTLTTRIYAQTISSNNLNEMTASYESAFASLILMLLLIYIGYVLIPNWKTIKQNVYNHFLMIKRAYFHEIEIDSELLNKQLVKRTLYLSYSQMKFYGLNKKIDKKFIINNKIYNIRYLQDECIQKMNLMQTIYI